MRRQILIKTNTLVNFKFEKYNTFIKIYYKKHSSYMFVCNRYKISQIKNMQSYFVCKFYFIFTAHEYVFFFLEKNLVEIGLCKTDKDLASYNKVPQWLHLLFILR